MEERIAVVLSSGFSDGLPQGAEIDGEPFVCSRANSKVEEVAFQRSAVRQEVEVGEVHRGGMSFPSKVFSARPCKTLHACSESS